MVNQTDSQVIFGSVKNSGKSIVVKPKAQKGNVFWVRETWQESECFDYHIKNEFVYRANNAHAEFAEEHNVKWKPSIFMPKAACRLFLKVTDVRVERLHDISEDDMIAEGIRVPVSEKGNALLRMTGKNPPFSFLPKERQSKLERWATQYDFLKAEWAALWSDINGRESWDLNPWVWAYTFKKINKPSNFI